VRSNCGSCIFGLRFRGKKQQVPPLRFASVGMTPYRKALKEAKKVSS
jgi:hypothetical protein